MDSGSAHIQSASAGMMGNDFVEPHIRGGRAGTRPAPTGSVDREEHPDPSKDLCITTDCLRCTVQIN